MILSLFLIIKSRAYWILEIIATMQFRNFGLPVSRLKVLKYTNLFSYIPNTFLVSSVRAACLSHLISLD